MINLKRCITDFAYYSKNLLKIKNKKTQLVPLKLWEPQVLLHSVVQKLITSGQPLRIIVLKARQEGISTYTEGQIFWRAHLNENTNNVIIAHEKESGNNIFGMCKLFYDCLPPALRPMITHNSKEALVFANPDRKTQYKNPGLRSSLEVRTAGKKSVARGTTIHNLHCSELSFWPFPQEVVPALLPTIPQNSQSLILYESTANGINNFFYNEWQRAKNNDSNFYPFFLPWFALPEYTREFNTDNERLAFQSSFNDEEKELQRVHHLTIEQLFWRRCTIKDLHGDIELFRQEYPSTDIEAFIVSGVPIFDRRKLRTLATEIDEPKFCGMLTDKGLIADSHGDFKIWKYPEQNKTYVMGIDVADGGERGDYSCIIVWKKLNSPLIAEQVAEWHGHLDPYNFAHICERVGRVYNEALASVEINAHGLATMQELQRSYWNIYRQEHFDRFGSQITQKIGWNTSVSTKKLLISFGTHCVSNLSIIIHSKELIFEALTFIRDAEGSAAAAGGGHDDRIMAGLIGLFTLHQSYDEPFDAQWDKGNKPAVSHSDNYIDKDFAQMIDLGKDDTYEQTWMNY